MLPSPDPETAFEALCAQVKAGLGLNVQLVGIQSGGVWVAQRLARELGLEVKIGEIDIAFYRDDFDRIGLHAVGRPTSLPFAVDDADILLVDDVLYTGRTIRGALNVLFDYGRPRRVRLATLFDRGGRELPVGVDFCGATIDMDPDQTLVLREEGTRFLATSEKVTRLRNA